MENKMNLVEILKDCPQGMGLDCTISNDVVFEKIEFGSTRYPVVVRKLDTGISIFLTKYGQYVDDKGYKCVIFPKGKTTWEGFVPQCQFKEGDIIYTLLEGNLEFISIFKKANETLIYTYVALGSTLYRGDGNGLCKIDSIVSQRLATEDEKQRLFDAIKDNGYKWNAETKTLKKSIEPKFKVGNKIKEINSNEDVVLITDITDDYYIVETEYCMKVAISMNMQNNYELVPNKFDITTLVPFESKVLVRESKTDAWEPAFYGFFHQRYKRFYTTSSTWLMCIPYNEDTKHLIGTTNDCNEFYKTWEERA